MYTIKKKKTTMMRASQLFIFFLFMVTTMVKAGDATEAFTLSDGNAMNKVGLGVYRAERGEETYQAVRWALELGYRLIDTAAMYGNEQDVGRAIQDSKIPRDEIFITTKLDTSSHGYDAALEKAQKCLERLGTSYVDLLLIHSPFGQMIVETWDALVKLQKEGKAKSIGVSNFGIKHLEAIREHDRSMPSVNQIEMHPLIYSERKDLIEYCRKHDIVITAYGSLFSGSKERYKDEILQKLAEKYGKSVPQILLRWALDNGFAVIPKSASSKERLQENLNILDFNLLPEEVDAVNGMQGEPLGEYWNPVNDAEVHLGDLSHKEEL